MQRPNYASTWSGNTKIQMKKTASIILMETACADPKQLK